MTNSNVLLHSLYLSVCVVDTLLYSLQTDCQPTVTKVIPPYTLCAGNCQPGITVVIDQMRLASH